MILVDAGYKATVSDFLMDRFEVTVGRLREFVLAYSAIHIDEGDGKSALQGDEGWSKHFPLPATTDELRAQLNCAGSTWTDAASTNENLPANCVTFYVAYAFCIWDGGRLPSEAEWNYAASGGSKQRVYPWSDPPNSQEITSQHAVFYEDTNSRPLPVGSKAKGDGRWGHADLAGNVLEIVLDYYSERYASDSCTDCVNWTSSMWRVQRGGSYANWPDLLRSGNRTDFVPDRPIKYSGFRCTRELR